MITGVIVYQALSPLRKSLRHLRLNQDVSFNFKIQ